MTRKRNIIGLAVAVVLLAGPGIYWLRPSEPSYQGKSLSQWLAGFTLTDYFSHNTNAPSMVASHAMGVKALPFLLYTVVYEEPRWKQSLRRWTHGKISLPPQPSYYYDNKLAAACAINVLGPAAGAALPTLTNCFWRGGSNSFYAALALAGIGHEGAEVLMQGSTNQNLRLRSYSAEALGFVQSDTDEAVTTLVKLLDEENLEYGSIAANSLGRLHHQPNLSIPALMKHLDSSKSSLRSFCVYAIGNFGAEAKMAIPALTKAMNDSNNCIRLDAKRVLEAIDPSAAKNPVDSK
jgi:HEAT repeat protein